MIHIPVSLAEHISPDGTSPILPWFVTIDASQIGSQEGIDWAGLAKRKAWGNLLAGSAEGEEHDLTCWLAPLDEETYQLAHSLLQRYPFSCTWLQSPWTFTQIAHYWQRTTNALLPNGHRGLLRFYDPCVLPHLATHLKPRQWQTITAPCQHWLYLDRFGRWQSITRTVKPRPAAPEVSLNQAQIDELNNSNREDWLIAHLMANEHLPQDADPFGSYERIHASVNALQRNGIKQPDQQYLFCAMTLQWPLQALLSEGLQQRLKLVGKGMLSLDEVAEQNSRDFL